MFVCLFVFSKVESYYDLNLDVLLSVTQEMAVPPNADFPFCSYSQSISIPILIYNFHLSSIHPSVCHIPNEVGGRLRK